VIAKLFDPCGSATWYLDIKGFFDNIDHGLMMKAVRSHTNCKWILLYIDRWLKAPVQFKDGSLACREMGTPQGGVISPLLANLFLHYAFDVWMSKIFPDNPFERYADDAVVHCRSEEEAIAIKQSIANRMEQCKLELHPQKTKIVYCKNDFRKGEAENTSFDFLGFTFRMRTARTKQGKLFNGFNPAISAKAVKRIRKEIRLEVGRYIDGIIHDFRIFI